MKKKIVFLLLLCTSTIGILAENVILIQGTYLSTSRIYEIDSNFKGHKYTESNSEAGLNLTTFIGKKVGFYSSGSVLLPFFWESNEVAAGYQAITKDGNYDELDTKIGIDMLLGVGFHTPATDNLSFILGGGAHYNGLFLDDIYLSESYMSNVLGVGFAANAIIDLTRNIKWNISITGAWDFLEFIKRPEMPTIITAKGGFTILLSTGIGFTL